MAAYGVLGEIEWRDAAIVGLPAVVGTVAGTALQQRVASRMLLYLLAAFMVGVAIVLILE